MRDTMYTRPAGGLVPMSPTRAAAVHLTLSRQRAEQTGGMRGYDMEEGWRS